MILEWKSLNDMTMVFRGFVTDVSVCMVLSLNLLRHDGRMRHAPVKKSACDHTAWTSSVHLRADENKVTAHGMLLDAATFAT